MVKVITSTELNRNAGAMLKLAESGEAIHITRNGKVVAILTRAKEVAPVTPDITKPVVEKRAQVTEPPETHTHTIETVTAEVDDWGLPVEHNTEVVMGNRPGAKIDPKAQLEEVARRNQSMPVEKPVGMEMGTSKKPANPEPLKPWRKPAGLSKSQQAGGKYER